MKGGLAPATSDRAGDARAVRPPPRAGRTLEIVRAIPGERGSALSRPVAARTGSPTPRPRTPARPLGLDPPRACGPRPDARRHRPEMPEAGRPADAAPDTAEARATAARPLL